MSGSVDRVRGGVHGHKRDEARVFCSLAPGSKAGLGGAGFTQRQCVMRFRSGMHLSGTRLLSSQLLSKVGSWLSHKRRVQRNKTAPHGLTGKWNETQDSSLALVLCPVHSPRHHRCHLGRGGKRSGISPLGQGQPIAQKLHRKQTSP